MREAIADIARGMPLGAFIGTLALLAAAAAASAWHLRRGLRRARLIEDTPTSLIRSAAQGYCELSGSALLMPGQPVVAPLTGRRCVWWRYKVEEKVQRDKGSSWETVESDESGALFALDDPTGRCVVDPDGADVIPAFAATWYGASQRPTLGPEAAARWGFGQRYRYTEQRIDPGVELFALGWFETASDPYQGADLQREISLKLAEWKQRPEALKARFDKDGDGRIDMQEWEGARQAARAEVSAQLDEQALSPGVHLMKRPRDGRPFLLSVVLEHALVRRFRIHAGLAFAVLGTALMVALRMLSARSA